MKQTPETTESTETIIDRLTREVESAHQRCEHHRIHKIKLPGYPPKDLLWPLDVWEGKKLVRKYQKAWERLIRAEVAHEFPETDPCVAALEKNIKGRER